jgi:hypothetical protein
MRTRQTNGGVLLIGGTSGVGKTSVAKQLGRRLGASWLHVDDVRLAFQRSRVALPEMTEALYFFEVTPAVWTLPPERLRDGLIGIGQVLSPALEVIIENHVDTVAPIVIEGDAILPSLWSRPSVRDRVRKGHVQQCSWLRLRKRSCLPTSWRATRDATAYRGTGQVALWTMACRGGPSLWLAGFGTTSMVHIGGTHSNRKERQQAVGEEMEQGDFKT